LDFKIKKTAQGLAYGGDLRHQIWLGGWPPKEKQKMFRFKDATDPAAQLIAQHMEACDSTPGWERSLWLDMRFYLQDNMLTKVDRASMMNGLEVRVPFLDVDLAQFAMRLTPDVKYKGKQSKYILKKLAEKYLPADIIYRSKKGFGIPVAKWLKGELKPLVDQHLLAPDFYKEGLIQPGFKQYLKEHETGKQDHRKLIWPLLILQLWRSHHSI
jgi:asparagine synthase (glutamine-hydrolysing)